MKLLLPFSFLLTTSTGTFRACYAFIPLSINNPQLQVTQTALFSSSPKGTSAGTGTYSNGEDQPQHVSSYDQQYNAFIHNLNNKNQDLINEKIVNHENKSVSITSSQAAYHYNYKEAEEEKTKEEDGSMFSEKRFLEDTLDYLAFTMGPTHIDTMRTLHNLALYMYEHDDDRESAITFFHVSYVQRRTTLGITHPDTIVSLNHLVLLHHDEGNYDLAKDFLFHRITSFEEQLDVTTLGSILKIAFAYHREGVVDNAIKCYKAYLDHYDDTGAALEDNSTTDTNPLEDKLVAQHNLAVLYQRKGEFDEAKPLLEECLVHRKSIYGETHPLTLGTLNNLAALFHKSGEYEDALSLYEYCLEIKMSHLGSDHPETMLTERNLKRLRKSMS